MAIKYNDGMVRLWKGFKENGESGIGIKFHRECTKKEFNQIHKNIKNILELKYGRGR